MLNCNRASWWLLGVAFSQSEIQNTEREVSFNLVPQEVSKENLGLYFMMIIIMSTAYAYLCVDIPQVLYKLSQCSPGPYLVSENIVSPLLLLTYLTLFYLFLIIFLNF